MTRSTATASPATAHVLNASCGKKIGTVTDWNETVKDAMKRRGMTRQHLARELGVNETTIGRWLNGRRNPAVGALRHIGAILGLSLLGTDPAAGAQAEENELLEAFRRMPATERRLLLHCLRERDFRCHNEPGNGGDR